MLSAIPFPDIDPVIFQIGPLDLFGWELGPLSLRWYALAYIAGLALGWMYIVMLARVARLWPNDTAPTTPDKTDDLLLYMTLGVVLGGRFGFVLFYQPELMWLTSPETGLPRALEIWNGGMSFHGGFLGVAVGVLWFCRVNGASVLQIGDAVACAAPIGLFFGRLANFINGELWGRMTDFPWGVVFPQVADLAERYPELAPTIGHGRHPSQLYEAALEGALLFALLVWLAWRRDALKMPGLSIGVFLVGYAVTRGFVEFFREPDAFLGFDFEILGVNITRGQMLCAPMFFAGIAFIAYARRAAANEPATT